MNAPRCRTPASLYLSDMQAKVSVSSRGVVALPAAMLKAAGIRAQSGIIAEGLRAERDKGGASFPNFRAEGVSRQLKARRKPRDSDAPGSYLPLDFLQ
jgi:hypothetical protein